MAETTIIGYCMACCSGTGTGSGSGTGTGTGTGSGTGSDCTCFTLGGSSPWPIRSLLEEVSGCTPIGGSSTSDGWFRPDESLCRWVGQLNLFFGPNSATLTFDGTTWTLNIDCFGGAAIAMTTSWTCDPFHLVFHFVNVDLLCCGFGGPGSWDVTFTEIPGMALMQPVEGQPEPPKSAGLGDMLESALTFVGVTPQRVKAWLGRDCNCSERKKRLNKLGAWAKRIVTGKTEKAKEYLQQLLEEE